MVRYQYFNPIYCKLQKKPLNTFFYSRSYQQCNYNCWFISTTLYFFPSSRERVRGRDVLRCLADTANISLYSFNICDTQEKSKDYPDSICQTSIKNASHHWLEASGTYCSRNWNSLNAVAWLHIIHNFIYTYLYFMLYISTYIYVYSRQILSFVSYVLQFIKYLLLFNKAKNSKVSRPN